jgi:hypothetical protein
MNWFVMFCLVTPFAVVGLYFLACILSWMFPRHPKPPKENADDPTDSSPPPL